MPLDVWRFVHSITRWRRRSPILSCASGQPTTHPTLAHAEYEGLGSLSVERTFVCRDGVNTVRLLQLTRITLLEEGQLRGANALVDESWSCDVFRRSKDVYEVRIRYSGTVVRAHRNTPAKPVAIKEAKGIPGMMTILEASDF